MKDIPTKDNIQRAFQDLNEGKFVRYVASWMRVPYETLRRWWVSGKLKGVAEGTGKRDFRGPKPKLEPENLNVLLNQAGNNGNWGARRLASAATDILKKQDPFAKLSPEWGRKKLYEAGLKGYAAPRRSCSSLNPPTEVDISNFKTMLCIQKMIITHT